MIKMLLKINKRLKKLHEEYEKGCEQAMYKFHEEERIQFMGKMEALKDVLEIMKEEMTAEVEKNPDS